ncbi:MAG: hypothetical protein GEU80_11630 [Dehalococcoidia bacterium]|nr:hypothetical protein [Dehalococcoidia bacterium]
MRVKQAAVALSDERLIIVVGGSPDEGAYLCASARSATSAQLGFIAAHARGPIRVALPERRAVDLGLSTGRDTSARGPSRPSPASGDSNAGLTSVVASADSARTVQLLAYPLSTMHDFRSPGSVFPMVVPELGVLVNSAPSGAAVDLCRLASLEPVAVLCQLSIGGRSVTDAARVDSFAADHEIPVVAAHDVLQYRLQDVRIVERAGETAMPLPVGGFRAIGFHSRFVRGEHMALVLGDQVVPPGDDPAGVPVYVHKRCVGAVFGSTGCDCAHALAAALADIAAGGCGVVLYLDSHGGIEHAAATAYGIWDVAIVEQILCDLGLPREMSELNGGPVHVLRGPPGTSSPGRG